MKGVVMKHRYISFCLPLAGVFLVVVSLLHSPAVYAATPYNPSLDYKGSYISFWLYNRNDPNSGQWLHAGFERRSFPAAVSCPEARRQLQTYGFWQGQMRANGSCGADAPLRDWAVGNWLNYKISNGSHN
jgi:hypothetical protein